MNVVITIRAEQPEDEQFEKIEVNLTKAFENLSPEKLTTHERVILARQIEGVLERAGAEIQAQRQAQLDAQAKAAEEAARAEAEAEEKKREAAKAKRAKK